MIVHEKKINTKIQLRFLFTKLKQAGYVWNSGLDLFRLSLDYNFPIYIQISDRKKVLYSSTPLPKDRWGNF